VKRIQTAWACIVVYRGEQWLISAGVVAGTPFFIIAHVVIVCKNGSKGDVVVVCSWMLWKVFLFYMKCGTIERSIPDAIGR